MAERWGVVEAALAETRFRDVRHVAETGSTNADVLRLAQEGAGEGVVLVADHQTSGRGRLGRSWQAPRGASLLVSILVRPRLDAGQGHLVTTALGVAAAEACRAQGVDAQLKWPNDLVVELEGKREGERERGETRKLSGMLAESVVDGDVLAALVLGIGINVNWPSELPDELADIAIAMNHVTGHEVSRLDLLIALLVRFEHWCRAAIDARATGPMLGRYRELSATIGRRVRVDLGAETVIGDAVDITTDGHLLVVDECADRPREIVAGDVVHLRAAG